MNGLYAKRASLDASLRELASRNQRLASLAVTYDNLGNRVEQSQRDYALLNDAYQEAVLQEQKNPRQSRGSSQGGRTVGSCRARQALPCRAAGSLAALLSVGLAFVFGFFNIRFFIPSKGVKGRREQREAFAAAGE